MPVAMDKPTFENFSPKKKEKGGGGGVGGVKEYGGRIGKKGGGKRSFLQRAKRFGEQGRLGKGFQVDSETYSYYVRVLELLKKDEFDTDEERELFVENSLSNTEGNEVTYSSNQLVSRVTETILPFASEEVLLRFCQAFTPSLRVIVSDPYSSHVLEKLLELTSSDKWTESKVLTEWFEKTSMFILNNFEDFTFDTYSSFVMKKALECLSGYLEAPVEKEKHPLAVFKKSSLLVNLYGLRKSNPKREKMLQDFAKRFIAWPQFNDLNQKPETARLMQNVIQTVHCTEKAEEIVKSFIARVLTTLTAPLKPDDLAQRTLEVCLTVADKTMYDKIFTAHYKGHLMEYCSGTSYTLQKIVASAPDIKSFNTIFNELSSGIETLIRDGKAAIIHHLAEQCNKHNTKQAELYKVLKSGVQSVYGKDANVLFSLMKLGSRGSRNIGSEDADPPKKRAMDTLDSSYFGTCLVEQLMDFSDPTGAEVVNSLIEIETTEIRDVALDRKASFIVSKFFKSWKVPQKAKVKLLKKLKDCLVELASTIFGSRIIDEIWLWADIPQKIEVVEVLSQRIPILAANKFGRYMVENMGLNAFKRDKKEWMEHMTSVDKRKKDALDIAKELGLKTGSPDSSPMKAEEEKQSKSPKKKNKKRKSEPVEVKEEELDQSQNGDLAKTPKKKNKKRKSSEASVNEDSFHTADESQTETPKKKKKGRKSEVAPEEAVDEVKQEPVTPKKNKKGRKSEMEMASTPAEPETPSSHKKKKKGRKSEAVEEDLDVTLPADDAETPKKKKKKSRKSEIVADADTTIDEGQTETPKKKKKRKSEMVAEAETVEEPQAEVDTPKKKKNRKSKQFE